MLLSWHFQKMMKANCDMFLLLFPLSNLVNVIFMLTYSPQRLFKLAHTAFVVYIVGKDFFIFNTLFYFHQHQIRQQQDILSGLTMTEHKVLPFLQLGLFCNPIFACLVCASLCLLICSKLLISVPDNVIQHLGTNLSGLGFYKQNAPMLVVLM